jgi:peroxiredoxin
MSEPLKAGDSVVDFRLRALDGKTYDLGERRRPGALTAFVFWKKSCGTCQYAFPYFQRFHDQYADDRFQIWGISQESAEATAAFVEQYGATFPQLLDEDLAVTVQYGITNVPTLYLVDDEGTILRQAPAFIKDEFNAIAQIAAERIGLPYTPIVREEDNAPALKPG